MRVTDSRAANTFGWQTNLLWPARIQTVPNPDRLTGLDSSFLHLERDSTHMHVAGCMVFRG